MLNLTLAVMLSIANMVYAAIIYLSLHGWLVVHEPSGMQLLMHLAVTVPLVLITTIWLFYLSKSGRCGTMLWKFNLTGFLIPIMSVQTGVTYYHYDKVGFAVSIVVAIGLLALFAVEVRRHVYS